VSVANCRCKLEALAVMKVTYVDPFLMEQSCNPFKGISLHYWGNFMIKKRIYLYFASERMQKEFTVCVASTFNIELLSYRRAQWNHSTENSNKSLIQLTNDKWHKKGIFYAKKEDLSLAYYGNETFLYINLWERYGQ
jgi:hypothetical protein